MEAKSDGPERDAEVIRREAMFLEHLETIDRAIRFACRHGSLHADDVEDFASYVKLKLIENSYAVIGKYEARASFAAFISVVVQRMLLDYRIAQWGKWHASAQAKKLGDAAVAIEAMLHRDGRSLDEVLPPLQRRWPELTRARIEEIAASLPLRTPRPRPVELETALHVPAGEEQALRLGSAAQQEALSQAIGSIVRSTMLDLDPRDRLYFRLRFEGGMSVAEIARTLAVDQKALYRRIHRALLLLRRQLERAGISAADAEEVVLNRSGDLDFGFDLAGRPGGGPDSRDEEGT